MDQNPKTAEVGSTEDELIEKYNEVRAKNDARRKGLVKKKKKKRKRTSTFWKIEVFAKNQEGELIEAGAYMLDKPLGRYQVVSVPVTASTSFVKELRTELGKKLAKPILVVTSNIEFCKFTRMERSEVVETLEALDNED